MGVKIAKQFPEASEVVPNDTIGESLLDHPPRQLHNLSMNYQQHLKELQVQRLRARQNHMDVLLSYHTQMEDETNDPRVRELHHLQVCELNEALTYLDKLIQTLEQPYTSYR